MPNDAPQEIRILLHLASPTPMLYLDEVKTVIEIQANIAKLVLRKIEGRWHVGIGEQPLYVMLPVSETDEKIESIIKAQEEYINSLYKYLDEKFEQYRAKYGVEIALEYMKKMGYNTDFIK